MTANNQDPLWIRFLPKILRNLLEGRTSLLAVIHNSGWIFFDKILRALLGLLVSAWVARYLGPTQFGELAYCIAFIAIFQSMTNLGLDGIVVREVANHPNRANVVLGTTFQLRLLMGIFSWILALVIYGVTNSFYGEGIWIIGLVGAGMIFQVADTVDLWFQGNSQSKRTVFAKASAYLLSNAIRVCLVLIEAPLIAFAGVIAVEGALTASALYISYRQFPTPHLWKKNHPEARNLLKESWPYLISGLSIMLYMRIDQVMIKSMLGDFELGIFSAAIPISNLWNMIPMAICASIAPFIARKKLQGNEAYERALVKMFRIFWAICIMIIVVIWLLSSSLVHLMYGHAFNKTADVLNIYVLSCIPVFMGVGQNLWLLNEKKSNIFLLQTITGALVCVVTNFIFLPLWGVSGAAFAAILSQVSSCFLINGIFARPLFMMQLGFCSPQVKG